MGLRFKVVLTAAVLMVSQVTFASRDPNALRGQARTEKIGLPCQQGVPNITTASSNTIKPTHTAQQASTYRPANSKDRAF